MEISVYTRRVHKISSVCKYCRCSAAITMVRMRAEFVGPFGRHGHNFLINEPRLRIVLCVQNVQENRETSRMWNAVCNTFLECKNHGTGWHSSSTLWGVWRIWSDSTVRRWVRHFNEGRENLRDVPRSARPSVVNEDLVCEWKRRFKRTDDSPFRYFPCIFHEFHSHFFTVSSFYDAGI
jgi:transposase